jgi:hypothetical protein
VVDFAIDRTGCVWIIEINPFVQSTDAALFSWQQEREILERGPYEFRIRTEPIKNVRRLFADEWRKRFFGERR